MDLESTYVDLYNDLAVADSQIEELQKKVKKLEKLIHDAHESCLCERFDTHGFDYNETHDRLGSPASGARWNTPRDTIEGRIGFTWIYSKPEGCCDAKKVLKMSMNKEEIDKGFK